MERLLTLRESLRSRWDSVNWEVVVAGAVVGLFITIGAGIAVLLGIVYWYGMPGA